MKVSIDYVYCYHYKMASYSQQRVELTAYFEIVFCVWKSDWPHIMPTYGSTFADNAYVRITII